MIVADPKLGVWKAEIDRVIAANATKPVPEGLTLIRCFSPPPSPA